ncbi:hypothetical protein HK102_014133 [Quaeritorhiza haematococci]|nr:hypothetical protein HK102_014133 [Quaeritorhiza haematococci]
MSSTLLDKQSNGSMAPTKKEYLTGRDNMFIALDDEHHQMNVTGLYFFDKSRDFEVLKKELQLYVDGTPRCRQKLVFPKGIFERPYWEIDNNFSLDHHVRHVVLPAPGTEEQLSELAGDIHAARVDFNKPLWECVFFSGLDNGKRSVMLLKAHHCLSDGQGFVRRLLQFVASLDPQVEKDLSSLQYNAGRSAHAKGVARKSGKSVPAASLLLMRFYAFLITVWEFHMYLLTLLIITFNPRKSFKRTHKTAKKQVAWSTKVSLDDVKEVKNTFGVTVNDVLVSCLHASVEKYLSDHKQPVDSHLLFMIPTSMRRPDDWSISNQTSAYMLRIPQSGPDSMKRLKSVHQAMKKQKSSPESLVNYLTLSINFHWPRVIPRALLYICDRIHAVCTNVPGPALPIKWGSEPITEIVALIPQANPNSLGTSIYTYNGKVTFAVMMDVDKPEDVVNLKSHPANVLFKPGSARAIVENFDAAFAEMFAHARTIKKKAE